MSEDEDNDDDDGLIDASLEPAKNGSIFNVC